MNHPRLVPYLQATFAVVLWGASFVATKVALRSLAPDALVWLRFAMGLALLGIAVAVAGVLLVVSRSDLRALVGGGAVTRTKMGLPCE